LSSVLLIGVGPFLIMFTIILAHKGELLAGKAEQAASRLQQAQQKQWLFLLACVTIAAFLSVAAGIRFGVVTPIVGPSMDLGGWAPAVTTIYIIGATYCVMLLNGIHGAPNVLLLVSAGLVYFMSIGASEHVLAAMCAVVAGSALGSLRFNIYPARLHLGFGGTAVAGYLFAVLTVLSRQKTVAALLLILPLLLIVVVVGGFMLSLLERTMSIDRQNKEP
jgi:UDP-N-acetylmuramyl pentapeptide phosphotransferase/UDP-N-acetylglucosamine-1-phosphate transferase